VAGEGVSSRLLACYSARTDPAAYARTDPTAHEPSPTLHAAPWPPSASEFQAPARPTGPAEAPARTRPRDFDTAYSVRHRNRAVQPPDCPSQAGLPLPAPCSMSRLPTLTGPWGAATGSCLSVEFGVPFGLGSFPPTPTRHWRNPRRLAYAAQQIGALQRRHLRSAGRRAHRGFYRQLKSASENAI
jgi:hypothetical protein